MMGISNLASSHITVGRRFNTNLLQRLGKIVIVEKITNAFS